MMLGSWRAESRQRGQSSVFILIFTGVLLLGLISVYKSGKITSEKMELQNAADAAAYSVSVIEARDLNFMSYTNRAMVANEVAVAQMVGLVSWSEFLKSISGFMRWYDTTFLAGPTLGISSSIINPIAGVWDAVTSVIGTVIRTLGSVGTKILHIMNKIYSIAQTAYHAVSVVFMVTTLDEMIRINSPPRYVDGVKVADGARISEFGIISLIGHIISYGAIAGLQVPSITFTQTYFPNRNTERDQTGFERLAAITNEARDPFSRERGKTKRLWPPHDLTSGWTLDLVPPIHIKETIDIVIASVTIILDLEVRVDRKGGTELRHVSPGGTATASAKNRGREYNWSAGDTLAVNIWLGAGLEFEALGIDVGGFEVQLRDSSVVVTGSIAGIDFKFGPFPAPTGAPLGSGGAQAGHSAFTLAKIDQLTPSVLGGKTPISKYGTAPASALTWMWMPHPMGAAKGITANNIAPSYRGLPMYTDVVDQDYQPGFLAPFLIIGLVKDLDDVRATGPDYSGDHLDVLRMNYGVADHPLFGKRIGTIAKSEVYFKRPLDLDYFSRLDGHEELGNAFNPFWQARLVDTSWADRVVSLLVQQGQEFTGFTDIFNISSPGDLIDLIL